jgi:hypothetical protein
MKELMSWEASVLKVRDELMLVIPLADGGSELAQGSRGISEVHGEFLKIVIPGWIAGMLRIAEGDLVCVRERDGELQITASNSPLAN